MKDTFMLGVLLAVGGNLFIACSLTMQKMAHNKALRTGKPPNSLALFWVALIGMIVGEIGNFAAFGLASPTVVSPLGAVSVIASAILAVLLLHETFYWRSLVGMLCTVGGAVVVVIFAPPTIEDFTVDGFVAMLTVPTAVAYFTVVAAAVGGLALLQSRLAPTYVLVPLGLCSLLGSITVLCSSAFAKFIGAIAAGDAIA